MRENFQKSLDRVLAYEGGYSNDPDDPGGVTLEGIIQRVYDGYRIRSGRQTQPLRRDMLGTPEWQRERNDIYRRQYWLAVKGDELPAGLDFVMFDGAVNSGPGQAIKWLQRALQDDGLYRGRIDGDCGLSTMAAVHAHPDHDLLIAGVLMRRLGMLQSLRTWRKFGKGWSARVGSVRAIGQAWASGSIGPQPLKVAGIGGNAKGYAGDVAVALISQEAGTNTAAGGTGLAALVQGAAATIGDYASLHRYVAYLVVALTVAGALIAIGGAVSAFISSRQNAHAQRAIDGDVLAELPALELAPAPAAATAPRRKRRKPRKA